MELTAYRVHPQPMQIVPASKKREWMEDLPERFANRCLPLRIANESGWFILNSHTFEVTWLGGQHQSYLLVRYYEGEEPYPASTHFGGGILTFSIPYVFRTEPDYNLLVRGPANMPKVGASPLEGVVETDWSHMTFTMNWQITHINEPVLFQKGEPICQIVPQRRGELEEFEPELLDEQPEGFGEWSNGRRDFLRKLLKEEDSETVKQGWQREYFQGRKGDAKVTEHQTKLRLKGFNVPGL
jgi:hypothetical protein